ncbi:MAG: ABC transporter permease [Anaerolineae bacterium]|jgi:ABC-type dipeptide/oligopeptide/nickel transport system permease component|nr:ABC transporter permease [Anaerolineae bacterium]
MWQYIGRRLLVTIPLLLGLTVLVFGMLHLLPGDPVQVILATSGATPDAVAKLRSQLGLDLPLHIQYFRYLNGLLHGDMGSSLFTYRPVTEIIRQNMGATLELAFSAMLLALVVGIPLGILAAVFRDSWIDHLAMTLAVVGVSAPGFWTALLMILLFSVVLQLLPSGGHGTLKHLIMPTLVLGLSGAAVMARLTRSSMLEVLRQEYIVTARAKGGSELYVLVRHALKNSLIPIVTVAGLQFGFLLGGTVVTEMVFARPGLGRTAVEAILYKDIPVVQGIVLFVAVIYMLVNLLVDLCYALLDPRIRYS